MQLEPETKTSANARWLACLGGGGGGGFYSMFVSNTKGFEMYPRNKLAPTCGTQCILCACGFDGPASRQDEQNPVL